MMIPSVTMPFATLIRLGLIFTIGVMMSACHFKAPEELRFEGVSWEQSSWKEKKLFLKCSLYNPNSKQMTVKQTNVKLMVEGVDIGTLSTPKNFTMTALQRTEFNALLQVKPLGFAQLTPIFALKRKYNLRVEGIYQISGKKLGVQQNIVFDPASETYKGLFRILQQLTDKKGGE